MTAMSHPLLAASARNIRRFRQEQGLTLEQLSERSGIARTTLVKWEAGQGNPTLATLGAAANALGLDAPALLATEDLATHVSIVRAGTGIQVGDENEPSWLVGTSRVAGTLVEFYEMGLEAASMKTSSPGHGPGTLEHAYVVTGAVQLGPLGHEAELNAGDFASYPADGLHLWRNISEQPAQVFVVLTTPLNESPSSVAQMG